MTNLDTLSLAVSLPDADTFAFQIVGLGLVLTAWIVLRQAPKLATVLWFVTVGFVPVWLGMAFTVYFIPTSLVGLLLLTTLLPDLPRRIGFADYAAAFLIVASLLPLIVGGSTETSVFVLLSQWTLALVLGRLLPQRVSLDWIYRCITVVFTIVSVLGIIEFVARWNPFVLMTRSNSAYSIWAGLQERGGIVRAEGAFGHAIAMGASVAIAIPLALASSFKVRTKMLVVAVMVACTVVTFSRTGMICAVLGIALSVLFLREGMSARIRVTIVAAVSVLAVFLIPVVTSTFAAAGTEATGSSAYRGRLISLVPDMAVLGYSPVAHETPNGQLYMGNFRSIDSELILFGLTYGWLPLLFAALLLVGAIVAVLTRRATPPTIAMVAQIPAIATVATITQYGMLLWFVGGLALYAQTASQYARGNGHDLSRVRTGSDKMSPLSANSPTLVTLGREN